MIIYCTVFDQKYLSKAISWYESLYYCNSSVHIYMLCLDDFSFSYLSKLKLKNIYLFNHKKIQDKKLKNSENNRNRAEYAWTCKPYFLDYILKRIKCDWIVYVDVDAFFFSDPVPFLPKFGIDCQITPHNFSNNFKNFQTNSGFYNAGYFAIKNTHDGIKINSKWLELCYESCNSIPVNGNYGDQKHLELISNEFNNIDKNPSIGLNTAPWNIENYKLSKLNSNILLNDIPLVFYHFQALSFISSNRICMYSGNLKIKGAIFDLIYKPYINSLIRNHIKIINNINDFNFEFLKKPSLTKPISFLNYLFRYHQNAVVIK